MVASLLCVTSIGFAEENTIHACVSRLGIVRIVASPNACLRYERPLSWNIAGSPGPAGPAGPMGAPGPQGLAGVQGPVGPRGPGFGSVVTDPFFFVDVNACGSLTLIETPIILTEPARIFVAGTVSYARAAEGSPTGSIFVQLLDGSNTAVASPYSLSYPLDAVWFEYQSIPVFAVLQHGRDPHTAAAGTYTLRMTGRNVGHCEGFGSYVAPMLSYIVLGAAP